MWLHAGQHCSALHALRGGQRFRGYIRRNALRVVHSAAWGMTLLQPALGADVPSYNYSFRRGWLWAG